MRVPSRRHPRRRDREGGERFNFLISFKNSPTHIHNNQQARDLGIHASPSPQKTKIDPAPPGPDATRASGSLSHGRTAIAVPKSACACPRLPLYPTPHALAHGRRCIQLRMRLPTAGAVPNSACACPRPALYPKENHSRRRLCVRSPGRRSAPDPPRRPPAYDCRCAPDPNRPACPHRPACVCPRPLSATSAFLLRHFQNRLFV